MVKITYDLNNKSDCKLVNDYYNLKYFLKCLHNDWYYQHHIAFIESCSIFEYEKNLNNFNKIVYKHIDKKELNYYLKLIFALDIMDDLKKDDYYYLVDLIGFKSQIIKDYKEILIDKFGPKRRYVPFYFN